MDTHVILYNNVNKLFSNKLHINANKTQYQNEYNKNLTLPYECQSIYNFYRGSYYPFNDSKLESQCQCINVIYLEVQEHVLFKMFARVKTVSLGLSKLYILYLNDRRSTTYGFESHV